MSQSSSTLTFDAWLIDATNELSAVDIPNARLDSEIILSHTIHKNRTYIHAHPDETLSFKEQDVANARLSLRLDRVPVAYIIGHKEFYGRRFSVSTATLIPRPESEAMIEALKELVTDNIALIKERTERLVDVGTGSGALGITAKLEFPELDVTLLDISRHALNIAELNANTLNADVKIMQSDLLEKYPFKTDYILANLPYVDKDWDRSPETEHEPEIALFAGDGGKALIIKLMIQSQDVLVQGGYLLIEADPVQHDDLINAAKQYNLTLQGRKDYCLVFQTK
jgi:release factor glutamine methyltransferase